MSFYRLILLGGVLVVHSLSGFSQTTHWNLVDGKAIAEKKISMTGKTQNVIYKDVYRWLIKVYKDPEDILKARIENEYLRGVGYNTHFMKIGEMSGADLQYTFAFEIKNSEVIFKISNALLIYSTNGDYGPHPFEKYMIAKSENGKKKKRNEETERILTSVNDFSNSLFASLENHLFENGKNR